VTAREEFGPGLRRERERRGITLEQITAQTKIGASFFAGLERNDVSRWPGGIFRKAFLRAYAEAVGLDADRLVQQFLRLFPSSDDVTPAAEQTAAAEAPEAGPPHLVRRDRSSVVHAADARPASLAQAQPRWRRVVGTGIDLGIVCLLAVAGWLIDGWVAVWPTLAVSATLIFLTSSVVLHGTFGIWLLTPTRRDLTPAPRLVPVVLRPTAEERTVAKRRPVAEPHQSARRHDMRRGERSRPRRA
jgi:transcriptional regulator with XRE-family HTH domain